MHVWKSNWHEAQKRKVRNWECEAEIKNNDSRRNNLIEYHKYLSTYLDNESKTMRVVTDMRQQEKKYI